MSCLAPQQDLIPYIMAQVSNTKVKSKHISSQEQLSLVKKSLQADKP